MIHTGHTYKSPLKSFPSHDQLLCMFGLLQATLQQIDYISSTFPVTLWAWVKVASTSIKMQKFSYAYPPTKFERD